MNISVVNETFNKRSKGIIGRDPVLIPNIDPVPLTMIQQVPLLQVCQPLIMLIQIKELVLIEVTRFAYLCRRHSVQKVLGPIKILQARLPIIATFLCSTLIRLRPPIAFGRMTTFQRR